MPPVSKIQRKLKLRYLARAKLRTTLIVWAKNQLKKTAQTARLTEKGSVGKGITGLESANGFYVDAEEDL